MILPVQLDDDNVRYLANNVSTKGLIKNMKITTEMVSLTDVEKKKIKSEKIDYIITQIQESKSIIPQDPDISSIVDIKHNLNFKNSVKEIIFYNSKT